jgi:HD domain
VAPPPGAARNSKAATALSSEVFAPSTHLQTGLPTMLPTIAEAHELLHQAGERNPGPWLDHSKVAARAAQSIAAGHADLDPDRAYVLGLLHDIGRGAGGPSVADVRHILDGYRMLLQRGFDDCARISITHSFPIKHVDAFASTWDCPPEERAFVQQYLDSREYTTYDRLIQLCDALALPSGPCVIEKRLVDVALRHGFNALTLSKWQAIFSIEREFSAALAASIYTVLPGVVDTTFGFSMASKAPSAH